MKGLTERGDQDKAGPCGLRTLTLLIPGLSLESEAAGSEGALSSSRGGLLGLNAATGA